MADTCFIGPEAEFFIFDDVRFDQTPQAGYFYLDSVEAAWNRRVATIAPKAWAPTLVTSCGIRKATSPAPPADQLNDIRAEMMQLMIDCGLDVECQHHEVATAGQAEIDLKFNDLVTMGRPPVLV